MIKERRITELEGISAEVRKSTFETIYEAGSGHLGGNSSSVELMTTLYFGGFLDYDPQNPKNENRDIVLVRGHEGPLRYKIFSLIGYIPEDELKTYRQLGSRLQGHECMDACPGVDITPSGSLGMVLSYGVGAALSFKERDKTNKAVVFLGDGEEQEGNVAEAARNASNLKLDNLVCILDKNAKQLSGRTACTDGKVDMRSLWEGYGWDVYSIENGNDVEEVYQTYQKVFETNSGNPRLIIAKTVKGLGLPGVEDHFSGAHTIGAYRNNDGVQKAILEQDKKLKDKDWNKDKTKAAVVACLPKITPSLKQEEEGDSFDVDIEVTEDSGISLERSQIHYFKELRRIIETNPNSPHFYILTPDFVLEPLVDDVFKFKEYATYIDVGIREQHAIAMSHGISVSDPHSRIVHFYGDAFLYRSMDQLNAAVQGKSKAIIFSERAGITQERNGSTHQTVGQPGAVLTMPDIYFKEPGDVKDLYNVLNWFFTQNPGWVYLRTHSNKVNLFDRESRDDKNINFYVVHDEAENPDVVLVSSGLTLPHALEAAKKLRTEENIKARVINVIDPKSLDGGFCDLLTDRAPVYTVYNGSPVVLQMAVAKTVMENPEKPRPSKIVGYGFLKGTSAKVPELERLFELDSQGIFEKVVKDARSF